MGPHKLLPPPREQPCSAPSTQLPCPWPAMGAHPDPGLSMWAAGWVLNLRGWPPHPRSGSCSDAPTPPQPRFSLQRGAPGPREPRQLLGVMAGRRDEGAGQALPRVGAVSCLSIVPSQRRGEGLGKRGRGSRGGSGRTRPVNKLPPSPHPSYLPGPFPGGKFN